MGDLPEPYRSTILLRYFEDLSAQGVSQHQRVPVTTVKSRVKRGLEMLRAKLDGKYGGRRAWLKALAPLAAWQAATASSAAVAAESLATTTAATNVPALTAGGVLMTQKAGFLVTAVAVLGVSVGIGVGRLATPPPVRDVVARGDLESTGDITRTSERPTITPQVVSGLDSASGVPTNVGVIAGKVSTPENLPLEGVTVAAWPAIVDGSAATPITAVSGADGTYRLEGLASRDHVVVARRLGFRLEPTAAVAIPGASVVFMATAIVELPLTVLGPSRASLSEARIAWTDLGRRRPAPRDLNWKRDVSVLELPPGHHELRAFDVADAGLASAPVRLWIASDSVPEPLVLSLERRLSVRGRVLVEADEAPDRVQVHLLAWEGDATPTRKRMIGSGRHLQAERSTEYRWRFDDLDPGRYWIAASRFPDRMETEDFVKLESSPVDRDLQLPPLDATAIVLVRVFGPDGAPLTDPEFLQTCETDGSSSSQSVDPIPLSDGSFAILPDRSRRPCDSRDAKHSIEVRSQVYGTREVEYEPGSGDPVIVRFDELAMLTLELEGEREADRGLLSLFLDRAEGESSPSSSAVRLPGGSFEFPPVEPGSYKIVFMLQIHVTWGSSGGGEFMTHRVELSRGENHLSFPAPRLHDLTVIVPGATGSTRIHLRRRAPDRSGWTGLQLNEQPVDDTGRTFFEAIPAGGYTLLTEAGYGEGEMDFEISGDATIRYEPKPYTAFRVNIIDPEAPLARQGFEHGDTIVALDGQELPSGNKELWNLLSGLERRNDPITCDVVRGSRTFRIQIAPQVLFDRGERRGWITPSTR